MELYAEILCKILSSEELSITFPNQSSSFSSLVDSKCYHALTQIKYILEDDKLSDEECFQQIEAIVCLFESLGSGCDNRHDFG